jgi:uncharacterized protein (DUF2141 family)
MSLSLVAQTNTYDLTVKVNGIKNKKGMVEFGLFRDPEYFALRTIWTRLLRDASFLSLLFYLLLLGHQYN